MRHVRTVHPPATRTIWISRDFVLSRSARRACSRGRTSLPRRRFRRTRMTVGEILAASIRRWYILIGVLACAALVTVLLARDGGGYATSTVVTFSRSATTTLSPYNGSDDSSVVAFAGAVVNAINNGSPPPPYSMSDAPYYGAGVREGIRVDLVDTGNQWQSSFSMADVEIQIVGRSLDWVSSRQDEMVALVLSFADAEQAGLSIPADDRIAANVSPLTSQIEPVSPTRSSQAAAAGAMLVVALILGAWGAVTLDRQLVKRRTATAAPTQTPIPRILEGSPS